jgi:proteasome lid subunit RPN8/RPN11
MILQGIREELLELLLALGKSQHPREFVALLREQDGILEEIDMLPGTVNREDSASLPLFMAPLDTHAAGSAHSHPNGVLDPSPADLGFFPTTGAYHLIIGYPYTRDSWRCYTADGKPHFLKVIP